MALSVDEIRDIIKTKYCPEFEFACFDSYPWTPLQKKIKDSKLALLTTGGIHVKTDKPFDIKNKLGDYTYREIPGDVTLDQLMVSHPHYDTQRTSKDLNCIFPIDRMREFVNEGVLGSLSSRHYSFMGYTPIWEPLVNEYAPQVASKLNQEGVDIALITYGWATCNQTVGLISRILEESGISTVGITNIPDLIRQTKAPRALAVKYPYGLPLGAPGNIETQRKIILDAFKLLETTTKPGTIWELSYPYRKKWFANSPI